MEGPGGFFIAHGMKSRKEGRLLGPDVGHLQHSDKKQWQSNEN